MKTILVVGALFMVAIAFVVFNIFKLITNAESHKNQSRLELMLFTVVILFTLFVTEAHIIYTHNHEDYYYLPAEILMEGNNHVCFTTDNGTYIVDKSNLDKNTEYLLTMFNNGTDQKSDDVVSAIWEVK